MRNLAEYPLTRDEVLECLNRLRAELNPELIGDMTPLILRHAISVIESAFKLRDAMATREPAFVVPFAQATELCKAVDFKPEIPWASPRDVTGWKPDPTTGSATLPDSLDPEGVLREDGT
jgi:hypothetical protein